MAKRRNRNKLKRRLAGLTGRDRFGLKENNVKVLSENSDGERTTDAADVLSELTDQVQLTETASMDGEGTEKFGDDDTAEEMVNSDSLKLTITKGDKMKADKLKSPDEAQITPREIDGETCLDIECGANEALLVLSKLWLGSKGACIKFMDKWLTPNEFQAISGRESAKDWKRSIRHNAKSLKVLITKGLIDMKAVPVGKKSKKKFTARLPTKDTLQLPDDDNDDDTPPSESHDVEERDDDVLATEDDAASNKVVDDTTPQETDDVNSVDVDSVGVDSKKNSIPDESFTTDMKENREVATESTAEQHDGNSKADAPQPKRRGRKPKRQRQRHQMLIARAARKVFQSAAARSNARTDGDNVAVEEKVEVPEPAEIKEPTTETLGDIMEAKPVVTSDVSDTRSDEERRLDGFLQTLRLTKATGCKVSKTDPELPVINLPVGKGEPLDDTDDVEMPVLEKVSDLSPAVTTTKAETTGPAESSPSAVDGLHATVTPPPTPPGDKVPIEQKLVETSDAKVIATFKSRLSPTGDGLKLTINREKVKMNTEGEEEEEEEEEEAKRPCNPVHKEQNMQTLLLQDALQSAKKYKEKLQQSKQNCTNTNSSAIQVPRVSSDYTARDRELFTERKTGWVSVNKRSVPQEHTNRAMHFKHASGHTSTTSSIQPHKSTIDPLVSSSRPPMKADKLHDLRLHTSPKHGTVPVSGDAVNQSLINHAMYNLSSMYGPQYYPADKKDAIMLALQDAQRKGDALRQFPTGAMSGADASPLLYPMMTQQILLAMTQQLYSMCNVPTSSVGSLVPPQDFKTTLGVKKCKTNELDYLSRCSNANGVTHTSKPYDMSSKKRKHTAVDANGALDLSMKRTKYNEGAFESFSKTSSSVHKHVDIPLDFSVKAHSVADIRTASASTSFPAYLQQTQSAKQQQDKQYMQSFYRSSPPVDTKSKLSDSYGSWSNNVNGFLKSQTLSGCTCGRKKVDDITNWGVEQVCDFLKTLDGCGVYSKTFQEQGISGQILPVLTTQHLTRTLGMKVGPALTLMHAVERKFREKLLAPSCSHCSRRLASAVHI